MFLDSKAVSASLHVVSLLIFRWCVRTCVSITTKANVRLHNQRLTKHFTTKNVKWRLSTSRYCIPSVRGFCFLKRPLYELANNQLLMEHTLCFVCYGIFSFILQIWRLVFVFYTSNVGRSAQKHHAEAGVVERM